MHNGTDSSRGNSLGSRKLMAIMFTDVVGSSRLMGDDEDRVMVLIKRDLEVIRKLCQQYDGRVLKYMGDGCLAVFESAVHAVECARDIQRTFLEMTDSLPPGDTLEHRIGIHLGDVYITEDDAMGDGVNVAARLQSEAPNGGICISQALYEVVKTRLSLKTLYQGPRKLKNIRDEVHLYEIVEFDGEQSGGEPHPYAPEPASRKTAASAMRHRLKIAGYVLLGIVLLLIARRIILGKPSNRQDVPLEFSMLDANGDMVICRSEYPRHLMERFDRADIDRNDSVTVEEFTSALSLFQQREEYCDELFIQMDLNGDGRITQNELPMRLRNTPLNADADHDGTLTREEFLGSAGLPPGVRPE